MLGTKLISNAAAKVWLTLLNFAFVPLYIRFLGIEAFGLIGFYATLQGLFSILDLGLSTALNRKFSTLSNQFGARPRLRDLLHTVELIYLSLGILIGTLVFVFAPAIEWLWLHSENVNVTAAVRLIGPAITAQWPLSLYSAGLMGLQRQEINAFLTSIVATARTAGAVVVLWLVAPTIEAFFSWQIVVSVLALIIIRTTLVASLGRPSSRRVVQFSLLRSTWRFAAGITCISAFGLVFNLGDKLALSALAPLKTLGYYTLGTQIAAAAAFLSVPVYNASFPRFSQLASTQDSAEAARLYHRVSQLLAVAALPPAVIISLFPQELVLTWMGDPEIAQEMMLLVPILVIGSAFNAVNHAPHALMLAYGWTRLEIAADAIAACVLGPLLLVLAWNYGAVGAAVVWLLYNAGVTFIVVPLMHKRLMTKEKWRWYLVDIGRPLVTVLTIGIVARIFLPRGMTAIQTLIFIVIVAAMALSAALAASSDLRSSIFAVLNRIWLSILPA